MVAGFENGGRILSKLVLKNDFVCPYQSICMWSKTWGLYDLGKSMMWGHFNWIKTLERDPDFCKGFKAFDKEPNTLERDQRCG